MGPGSGAQRAAAVASLWASLALAAQLWGCGSDPGRGDAGAVSDGGLVDGGVAPPDIPWLDEGVPPLGIAPCPEGWREVMDGSGVTSCDGYPEGGASSCPPGEAHFVGEPGCAPVGPPCPSDGRVADLPSDRVVVHVLEGGRGDGTASSPYGSLTSFSWGGLSRGTIVAVGRGDYDAPVRLPSGIALWGACVTGTRLSTTVPHGVEGVVTVLGAEAELRGVSIGPAPRPGVILVGAGRSARLDGVWIEGVEAFGAVVVSGEASLVARALVVKDTRALSADGVFGRGLDVEGGARAEVSRGLIERNREIGVYASGTGTAVRLSDVAIRDTQSQLSDGTSGRGLHVERAAHAEVSRAVIAQNRDVGVSANSTGTVVTLSDVIVCDTESQTSDGTTGRGLNVQLGARVDVNRAVVDRSRDLGVFVGGADTAVTMSDVAVRDTRSRQADGAGGRGLAVQDGAQLEVSRAAVERNREIGVLAARADALVTLTDVVVRDTQSQASDGGGGRAVSVQLGAHADVRRSLLERSRELGVYAADVDTVITLSDVAVRDTQGRQSDGRLGWGMGVQQGAQAEVSGAELALCREVGVAALGDGTALRMWDVRVLDTEPNACGVDGRCAERSFGMGVGSYVGASVELARFEVRGSALCGVQVADEGALDLADGVVGGSPIGACVQVRDYDLSRLTDSVWYVDNGTNLQATDLPVPDPVAPIERL